MKVKRFMESRIRGWFPQEPKGMKLSIIPTFEANNPKSQNNIENSKTQISTLNIVNLIFWTILGSLWLTRIFPKLSIQSFAVVIIVGALIGASLGALPAYKVLKALAQGRKIHANLSEIIFFAFLLILLIVLVFSGFIVGQDLMRRISEPQYMLFAFAYSSGLAIANTRIILFSVWERKNNCKILRGKRLTLFISSKISSDTRFSQSNQKSES